MKSVKVELLWHELEAKDQYNSGRWMKPPTNGLAKRLEWNEEQDFHDS